MHQLQLVEVLQAAQILKIFPSVILHFDVTRATNIRQNGFHVGANLKFRAVRYDLTAIILLNRLPECKNLYLERFPLLKHIENVYYFRRVFSNGMKRSEAKNANSSQVNFIHFNSLCCKDTHRQETKKDTKTAVRVLV